MPKPKVVYNEDGNLLMCLQPGRAAETMREYLAWTTDRIPIDIYEFCVATPDVCYFDTKKGEVLGRRMLDRISQYMKEDGHEDIGKPDRPRQLVHHVGYGIELLRQEGHDALDIHVDHLHERGIKVVAGVRMGDTHHRALDPDVPLCPQFAIDHPEYVIPRRDGIAEVALDYSHPEVREHRLAIIREIVEDHAVDGVSLNFMRWAKYFERDLGREKAPIMTDFVGQVRAILDETARKRGTGRLILGARVLSTIDECFLAGCDVAAWISRGYMDYVIVSEHNSTYPGLKVEEFVEIAKGSNCEVYAAMGDMIGGTWTGEPDMDDRGWAKSPGHSGYAGMLNTPEEARAAAHNFYTWGAQGIGFWNIPNNFNPFGVEKWGKYPEHVERMHSWLLEAINPARVQAGERRYHYVPLYKQVRRDNPPNYKYCESGRSIHGEYKCPVLYFNEGRRGRRQALPFRMADGRNGEKLRGNLRFRIFHCGDDDAFDVDINGVAVGPDCVKRAVDTTDAELPWTWAGIDLADCPPFRGDNEMGIIWRSQVDHGLDVPYMEELDVTVRP